MHAAYRSIWRCGLPQMPPKRSGALTALVPCLIWAGHDCNPPLVYGTKDSLAGSSGARVGGMAAANFDLPVRAAIPAVWIARALDRGRERAK